MLKINHKKILFVIVTYLFVLSYNFVYAATKEYTPLEPMAFAGLGQTTSSSNQLAIFLGQVFNWGIAAAVVLALIMIIWGGIMYMTTDSWSGKEEGKTKIENALKGLGLALISYIILYTINPCTVDYFGNNGCDKKNTFLKLQQESLTKTPVSAPASRSAQQLLEEKRQLDAGFVPPAE